MPSPYFRFGSSQPPHPGLIQHMGMWTRDGVTQANSRQSLPPAQCSLDPASTLPSCHSTSTPLTEQQCQSGQSTTNPAQQAKSGSQSQGPELTSTPVMPTVSVMEGCESHPDSTKVIQESILCLTNDLCNVIVI